MTKWMRLQDLLVEELGVPPDVVRPESTLVEDLGMDSLDRMEVALAIEEDFDIDVSDEELATWETVADLQACIGDESE